MKAGLIFISLCLTLAVPSSIYTQTAAPAPSQPASVTADGRYQRTELYMGLSIPGGGVVSDEDWERFLNDVVTPVFPDGFTVLSGRGQYREATGAIAKEPSHVLVFLYPRAKRKDAGAKIENIRTEYKKRFAQESVLRVDITKSVMVSF